MDQALRAPGRYLLAALGTMCLWLFSAGLGAAQLPLQVNGLRGGRFVGSAAAISRAPRVTLGVGYAHTEDVLSQADSHERVFGEIAAAYAPRSYLQFALAASARYDAHTGASGSDSGAAFATDLATRHAFLVSRELSLGAQTRFRFPASADAGRGLRAVSPELGVLASYLLAERYELSVNAGYRFDRSWESVEDPSALSDADRLAAQLSRYDAALLGLLITLPTGPLTSSLEWSWDVAVGNSAPGPMQSPMRVRLATQMRLARRYVPGVELGVSPSARPALDAGVRIEPRFWAALNFGVVFEPEPRPATPAVAPTRVEAPAQPEPVLLKLRVDDPAGVPITDARITLSREGGESVAGTDETGALALTLRPGTTIRAKVERAGFEAQELELVAGATSSERTVTLVRSLPDGEIKGKVRSLRGGRPLVASIVVTPLGRAEAPGSMRQPGSVQTDESGNFRFDVPPGQYTLEISAEGHEPQRRQAQVELRGVTILVVDLRRTAK